MNRFRLVAAGMTLMLAMSAAGQQAPSQTEGPADNPHGQRSAPTVEDHLKMLSEKLALTAHQQAKARPILQEMQDATQKIMQNKKLSDQERTSKLRTCHLRADTKLRETLSDDQRQKLDQLEQEAHMDLHGNANAVQR